MAIGVANLVVSPAASEDTQHLTTDLNDAFGRLTTAVDEAISAASEELDDAITDVADDVTALTATVGAIVSSTGWRKISSQAASASATVDFTAGIDSTYDCYMIEIVGLVPGTSGSDFHLQISVDGGSSWQFGANDYSWHHLRSTDVPSNVAEGAALDTQVSLAFNLDAADRRLNGTIHLFNPSAAAYNSHHYKVAYGTAAASSQDTNGAFTYNAASAINGVRFFQSAGTIFAGTFTLYGLTK